MWRKMMFFGCVISTLLITPIIHAQNRTTQRYGAFVIYNADTPSHPTVRWLDIDSGEIIQPPLVGTAQCPGDWSPDGRWWWYQAYTDDWGQYVLDVDSGSSHLLDVTNPIVFNAAWSPDNTLLAYTTFSDQTQALIYDRQEDRTELVHEASGVSIDVHWQSNQVFSYFAINGSTLDIYTIDVAAQQVANAGLRFDTSILDYAMSSNWMRTAYNLQDGDLIHLWVVEWATQVSTPVGDSTYSNINPAWSPDGRWLAYFAQGVGMQLFDTQTGDTQTITRTPEPGASQQLIWSPDGFRALVMTTAADFSSFELLNLETRESQVVLSNSLVQPFPSSFNWVTNNTLLFTALPLPNALHNSDLYRFDLDTDEVQNLTNSAANEQFLCSWG